MFDFIRKLTKSEAVKRQEMITAYLDSALSPGEQHRFEQLLAGDPVLRASVDQQHLIKQQLRQLPRVPAPRNFTLNPALYGRSQPQASTRLYPYARLATAMAGILLVVLLATDFLLLSGRSAQTPAEEPLAMESQELAADQTAILKDVTRVVTETVAEEAAMAAEAMAEGEMAPEEPAEAIPEAPTEELPSAAPAAELLPMATQPAEGEAQPSVEPTGTVDAFDSGRQIGATPAADVALAQEDAFITASQFLTGTSAQGPEAQTELTSPSVAEDDGAPDATVNVLRLVEIALLVAVIVLVALTLYLRRM